MRRLLIVFTLALVASSCANLGLGDAGCAEAARDASSLTILNIQAVPTAKYTPCVDQLPLGWEEADWFAEDGRAGVDIKESDHTFLTATVTESCDVSGAVAVDSGAVDIERFEDIEVQSSNIEILIIPSGQDPLSASRDHVRNLRGFEIDDRPVSYVIDLDLDQSVSSRLDSGLSEYDFVWIVDEIDAEEGTVQLRSNNSTAAGHGLLPRVALGLIEDVVPEVFYRGDWYFTFDGGCITYEFDAVGVLAETIAPDAERVIGFFPGLELRQEALDQGFVIG